MVASRGNWGIIAATVFGAVFSIFGTFMYVLWPSLFENILNSKLILAPGSTSYGLWEVTPIPMYIEFYLFNWTNSDEVYDKNSTSAKPNLVELGPYVFREHRVKVIKEWCDDNGTVTYLQNRTWFFEPEMSTGSLDDLVTTVNVPAVTATFALRNAGFLYKTMLNLFMAGTRTKLHVTKTAREFLFDGYSDPLLNLASIVPASVVPVQIPFDKFGWFYARNNSATYDGVFNMFTGASNIHKYGTIGEWNYMNQTHFYEDECGRLHGSAGEFFPPYQTKGNLSLFISDLCRTVTLTYKEKTEFDGINGFRYWGDDTMFDNKTTKPENWCFCPSGECPPSGSIDISSCKFGAPAFLSFPHFFHADESYRDAVTGMKPNETLHQLFIDVEPKSGIPLQVSAAMQINILVQPMHEYGFLAHAPKVYFPCLWFKQKANIDDSIGPMVHLVSILPSIGSIVSLVMLSTGLSAIAILAICLVTKMCRKGEEATVLNSRIPTPLPTTPPGRDCPSSATPKTASKLPSMKSLLHAYSWRQKVIPSEIFIEPKCVKTVNSSSGDADLGTGCYSSKQPNNGEIRTVLISPISPPQSSAPPPKDICVMVAPPTPVPAPNGVLSRKSSQVSNRRGGELPPLYIEQGVNAALGSTCGE